MLLDLAISDFVLVPEMEIEFAPGFCALTGETGVGKSVVLAALDMALGGRVERSAVRPGADRAEARASFDIAANDAARALLDRHDVPHQPDDALVLRRQVRREGAGRAFIDDRPVGIALLREIGSLLVEMHGQRAGLALLEPAGQLALLDAWAGAAPEADACAAAWEHRRAARARVDELRDRRGRSATEAEFLQAALAELDALAPKAGETEKLAEERQGLRAHQSVGEAIRTASESMQAPGGGTDVASALAAAANALHRAGDAGGGALVGAREALERALAETEEAARALDDARADLEHMPDRLEAVETRLFDLRALGRKHDADPDALPELRERLSREFENIESAEARLAEAEAESRDADDAWRRAADALGARRTAAAAALAEAMQRETAGLMLGRLRFRVACESGEEWAGPRGRDHVVFEIDPRGDGTFAPLARIASGGEFSRLALALRVCLSAAGGGSTLIFDEADSGIGGATAAAVGERLSGLGRTRQVISVTHSPQVASAADAQWRIMRGPDGNAPQAVRLDQRGRQEEIARMLAGSAVTDEARGAAERLLAGG